MERTEPLAYHIVVTRRLSDEERVAYGAGIFTPHTTPVIEEDAPSFDAAKSRTAEIAAQYSAPEFIICVEVRPGPTIVMANEMATLPNEKYLRQIRESN